MGWDVVGNIKGPAGTAGATGPTEMYATFTFPGNLSVKIGQARFPIVGSTWTIVSATATVGTAPTTQAIIVDVNKNGTTIFSTQANRPQIAVGANSGTSGAPNTTSITSGDYLTVDIDQVGSGTPGADIVVVVKLTR